MRRLLFWMGMVVLGLEVAAFAVALHEALQLYQTARALQEDLRAATHVLTEVPPSRPTVASLSTSRAHFQSADTEATALLFAAARWRWLLSPARAQPAAAAEVRQATAALTAARDGSVLAVALLDSLEPLVASPTTSAKDGAAIVQRLREARPQLAIFLVGAADLDRELAQVEGGMLHHALERSLAVERDVLPELQHALRLALIGPAALGADGPVSYLVIAQNPTDIRPTGGFMGSWGVLTVQNGVITSLDYRDYKDWEDVRDPERGWPLQPQPVQRYLHFCCMDMQDANWYPDFPTTALVLEQFAQADQPLTIAGVIAFDPALVQMLLRVTGPVTLPAYQETVTASNVVDLANFYEGRGPTPPPPDKHGKQFLVDVAQALATRSGQMVEVSPASILQAIVDLLNGKHVLIAANDDDLANWLQQMHWDGAITTPPGDYLLLDDMSMSDNKVDEDIARTFVDTVRLGPSGSADVDLHITWQNRYPHAVDPAGAATTDFRDYFRIYVPPGTVVEDIEGLDETWAVSTESGHVVVPGYVVIPQAGSREITVRYRVPAAVIGRGNEASYALHVQIQPSVHPPILHLQVLAPNGSALASVSTALAGDRNWQFRAPDIPASSAPPVPQWDRYCAALQLVAGLRGPRSRSRVAVPTTCTVTHSKP